MRQAFRNAVSRFRQNPSLEVCILICATAFAVHLVLRSPFSNTALLYVAVPFAGSVLMYFLLPEPAPSTPWRSYARFLRNSTIVLLATAGMLGEGFLCVLMYMPIHYLVVSSVYLAVQLARAKRASRRAMALVIAAAALGSSVEGVTDATSGDRAEQVAATLFVRASLDEIERNMALPIAFDGPRRWPMALFPMAQSVDAGSLREGDVHWARFSYARWFFTNVEVGEVGLRLAEVNPRRIVTEVVHNSAYFSRYLDVQGTTIDLLPVANGTEVTLTVRYRRLLDPAWYFGPLQRLVVRQSAAYMIETVIARPNSPAEGAPA